MLIPQSAKNDNLVKVNIVFTFQNDVCVHFINDNLLLLSSECHFSPDWMCWSSRLLVPQHCRCWWAGYLPARHRVLVLSPFQARGRDPPGTAVAVATITGTPLLGRRFSGVDIFGTPPLVEVGAPGPMVSLPGKSVRTVGQSVRTVGVFGRVEAVVPSLVVLLFIVEFNVFEAIGHGGLVAGRQTTGVVAGSARCTSGWLHSWIHLCCYIMNISNVRPLVWLWIDTIRYQGS